MTEALAHGHISERERERERERESYPMNTNMTGFRWFSKTLRFLLLAKIASALEGLKQNKKV